MKSFVALKTFKKYNIIMTIEYNEYGPFYLLLILELIQQADVVNFMLFFNTLKISKILF